MSTVYHVECIGVEAATATCRVTVAQVPQPLVASPIFAFKFLWEGWYCFDHRSWWAYINKWPDKRHETIQRVTAAVWRGELVDYSMY